MLALPVAVAALPVAVTALPVTRSAPSDREVLRPNRFLQPFINLLLAPQMSAAVRVMEGG
jgi:hypothetical protein